ncbi:IGDC3-like protein, partial [Mya arenaria]
MHRMLLVSLCCYLICISLSLYGMEYRTLFLVHSLIVIQFWVTIIQCNPIVVPSGSVSVRRGQNKTLSCSYEGQRTDLTTICVWDSGRNGTFHGKVYIQQSPNGTCTKLSGNESQYGYSCQAKNVFTITIYNIGEERNGEQWQCHQLIGSTGHYQRSNQITIELQALVPITAVTMTDPRVLTVTMDAGSFETFKCRSSGGLPMATIKWFKVTGDTCSQSGVDITSLVSSSSASNVEGLEYVESILTFTASSKDDGLRICCMASNVAGKQLVSETRLLDVKYNTSISRFDVGAFPNQTIVAINELETVVIVCEVFSNPRSTVRLKQKHMATILVERRNVLQIEYVIQNASCSDAAVYTCSGFNNYTDLKRTPSKELQLLVKCSPRPSDSLEHIKRNFTGYLHGNVTFTFLAMAYPPPMFEWQTWNGTSYNKVNRGSHFITTTDLLTSLTILNIQVDDYVSYILEVSNGIAPNLREHFYLNPQDVPQCPTNFSLLSKSTTMATVQWNGEFNGGLQQSFVLVYKKRPDSKYYTLTKPEDDETVIYKVEISSLEGGKLYDVTLYSKNKIGPCMQNQSLEVKTDTEDITSNHSPIIGGAVGGSLGIVVAVIVLVFILRRKNTLNCACIMSILKEEDAGNDGPDNSHLYTPLEDSNPKSRVYYENTKRVLAAHVSSIINELILLAAHYTREFPPLNVWGAREGTAYRLCKEEDF